MQEVKKIKKTNSSPTKSKIWKGSPSPKIDEMIWVIDTSVSVDKESCSKFLSAMDEFQSPFIEHYVLTADTEVTNVLKVKNKVEAIKQVEKNLSLGRGGTDYRPAINWAVENTKKAIVFYYTDGYGVAPFDEPSVELFWVFDSKYGEPQTPFSEESGEKLNYVKQLTI